MKPTKAVLYPGKPSSKWISITKRLVAEHPILGSPSLPETIGEAWSAVWRTSTTIDGSVVSLGDLKPRAQIVGDLFENLLGIVLSRNGLWRRGSSKEKDIIYTGTAPVDPLPDFEIKTSGQATGDIYGNRSYVQPGKAGVVDPVARKKRSGFYLCVNFWQDRIFNVRVGWIDPEDWKPQKSSTGQMAGLRDYVYQWKLVSVLGVYCTNTPMCVIKGIGKETANELAVKGINYACDIVRELTDRERVTAATVQDVLSAKGVSPTIGKRASKAIAESDFFKQACTMY